MALNKASKDAVNSALAMMKTKCGGHRASAKAVSHQMANLAKQLEQHEKDASDADAQIASLQILVNLP